MKDSELSGAAWRRSDRCGATGSCVEVAVLDDGTVAMRSSIHPEYPVLIFTPAEWNKFLRYLRADQ
jgi:hypothetical protein